MALDMSSSEFAGFIQVFAIVITPKCKMVATYQPITPAGFK